MSNATATAVPPTTTAASASRSLFARKKSAKTSYFGAKELIHLFRGLASMLKAQINT